MKTRNKSARGKKRGRATRRVRPETKTLDAVWLDEAERRLAAYREERVQGIPAEDVIGKL